MNKFGFKDLNVDNWKQPDSIMSHFVKVDSLGQTHQLSENDWLFAILKPALGESVPKEVQSLFEVARGAMVYGYFFYPLFTLSAEQLFRVAETAIGYKCKELNAPKSKRRFQERIYWLVEYGTIDKPEALKWEAARKLRNVTSHPSKQMILLPGNALSILSSTAEQINKLFDKCQQVAGE